jgi:hypothetical protein
MVSMAISCFKRLGHMPQAMPELYPSPPACALLPFAGIIQIN